MIPQRAIPALGRPVSRLVLGTGFQQGIDQERADRLLDRFFENGGNCIDTALVYYNAEDVLGKWMAKRRLRDRVVIHAKGAHHEGLRKRVTAMDIRADLDATLRRLRTDYVDLFVLHRDDEDQPVGSIIDCLAAEQRRGRIRAFGCSNWTTSRLEEANAYAATSGLPLIAVSSPCFSLAFPNEPCWTNCVAACDAHSRHWYAGTGLPILGWSVLAMGFFNYLGPLRLGADGNTNTEWLCTPANVPDVVRVYFSERNFERLRRVRILAERLGTTTTQVALAWALRHPLNVFAIVGPRTEEELLELCAASEIAMSADEVLWLNLES